MKYSIVFLFLFFLACTPKPVNDSNNPIQEAINFKPPRNIVLMIGDGMGLTQISAGMYMNGNKLNLEEFPIVGLHKPYAFDNLITDSAAGATSFASGVKTYNGAIGVNADTVAVQTILEEAKLNGLSTGLIATCVITHATPASFYAHQPSRQMHEEIAADMLLTDVDIFIGGGKKYFDQRTIDERNLSKELIERGYTISDYFQEDFSETTVIDPKSNYIFFTANAQPLPAAAGRDYLAASCSKSLDFLKAHDPDNGFFMMIEGSQIDWGGHAKDSEYIISEMIDFDLAIGRVLDFAKADGNTLVIITADHETGGYAINPGSTMDTVIGSFTSDYHTGSLIPVFAYGPGSELFGGIYENTAIYDKMRLAFGFNTPVN